MWDCLNDVMALKDRGTGTTWRTFILSLQLSPSEHKEL